MNSHKMWQSIVSTREQKPKKDVEDQEEQGMSRLSQCRLQRPRQQHLMPPYGCSLLMLLIVGQAFNVNVSANYTDAKTILSPSTTAFAITQNGFPYEQDNALTISRPPRAGRSERQAEEEQVDRCRLFVEGDPTKNELYSPEYPNLYPKNINCTRVITAPKGQIIRLDFRNSFNIEAKEECKFDFLEIRDGQYGFSTLIGKYCGTDFPPEITSKERYLWLHFHSDETIEYTGFSAVYEYLDRNREAPSTDLNCTIEKDGYQGFINSTDVPADIREQVMRNKIAIDCIWRIQVKDNWKIFLKFLDFKLSKPNDCETNFLDIFPEQTVMPLRVKNFCGSAGESITAESNILHLRFFADQIAINSTFGILYTAFRDRGAACNDEEYDCEDATCISKDLRCNGLDNCKFRWDEESCSSEAAGQSEHVVIIVIVFGLILGGMVITFIVNCIRKIIRDQKIIRDVPAAMSNGIFHIDSFLLDAPKSAIFVGLHNNFLCDFAYQLDEGPRQQNDEPQSIEDLDEIHSNSNTNSPNICEMNQREEELEDEDDEEEEEDDDDEENPNFLTSDYNQRHLESEEQPEDQDDGIGFSCDSDSLTIEEPNEDEDDLEEEIDEEMDEEAQPSNIFGAQCLPTSDSMQSTSSTSSSMQCSSNGPTITAISCSSTSIEMDVIPSLTPPPPPSMSIKLSNRTTQSQYRARATHSLSFFHNII